MNVVYFVRPIGKLGPVKIGCTTLIRDRIAALNSWSPEPLEIAAQIEGGVDLERRFHAKFLKQRSHGEWFLWTEELEDVIGLVRDGRFDPATLPEPVCMHAINRPKVFRRPACAESAMGKARTALGLSQVELAKKLGVHQTTVSRFESGDLPLDERTVLALDALMLRAGKRGRKPALAQDAAA